MKGQTLIEVVISLGIGITVLLGVTELVINSLRNAEFTKNQSLANHYATQAMELVKRDRSIATGYYCLQKNGSNTLLTATNINGCVYVGSIFTTLIDVNQTSCNDTLSSAQGLGSANVTVSWNDSKCPGGTACHKSQLISCLSFSN